MPRVLPRMPDEAPAGYIAFVARHLEPLRRDAARVVGDEEDADRLYPDVLADVAARWGWLELLRTRLGGPAPPKHTCTRRSYAGPSAGRPTGSRSRSTGTRAGRRSTSWCCAPVNGCRTSR